MMIRMMKPILCLCLSLFVGMQAFAREVELRSPDGKLCVTVDDTDGNPTYRVDYDGVAFLNKSPLGLDTNIGDFTRGLTLTGVSEPTTLDETYELKTIKNSRPHYVANVQTYTFSKEGTPVCDVVFQVSNRDVAFKYRVLRRGETLSCVVNREATGFAFPAGTTTFLCPEMGPMTGFARTAPSYETHYTPDDTMGKNGWGNGYTFPGLFRNGDRGWCRRSVGNRRGSARRHARRHVPLRVLRARLLCSYCENFRQQEESCTCS